MVSCSSAAVSAVCTWQPPLLSFPLQPSPLAHAQPTEAAVARIIEDVQRGLYDSFHLNFSTHLPRPLMEKLAAGAGQAGLPSTCGVVAWQPTSGLAQLFGCAANLLGGLQRCFAMRGNMAA